MIPDTQNDATENITTTDDERSPLSSNDQVETKANAIAIMDNDAATVSSDVIVEVTENGSEEPVCTANSKSLIECDVASPQNQV